MGVLTDGSRKLNGGSKGRRDTEALWAAYWRDATDERRNELVEAYQNLVAEVVGRYAARLPRVVDRGDLETAANVGLIAAITSFDPSRRVRFEAYGEMRIRGSLLDELRSQDWLPRPWRRRMEHRKRARERLSAELGRDPQDEEIAVELGLTVQEYDLVFGTALPGTPPPARTAAVDEAILAAGIDVVPDPRAQAPGEKLTRDELLRLVAQKLTEQEYRLVYLRYWEELSMREIGELMDLSESRVCKIHSRLIERLQDRFRVRRDDFRSTPSDSSAGPSPATGAERRGRRNGGTKRGSVPP